MVTGEGPADPRTAALGSAGPGGQKLDRSVRTCPTGSGSTG